MYYYELRLPQISNTICAYGYDSLKYKYEKKRKLQITYIKTSHFHYCPCFLTRYRIFCSHIECRNISSSHKINLILNKINLIKLTPVAACASRLARFLDRLHLNKYHIKYSNWIHTIRYTCTNTFIIIIFFFQTK